MKSFKDTISHIDKAKAGKLLFAFAFILSCLTMNSNNMPWYMSSNGTAFAFFKALVVFAVVFIVSLINTNNAEFVSKFTCATLIIITPVVIFDYYVTEFSGSQFLYRIWWIEYIMCACAGVLAEFIIFNKKSIKAFYYKFWKSFTPLYVFTLIICFLRTPNTKLSTNFRVGHGTFTLLEAIINNPKIDFEIYVIFLGNIVVFIPLAFIISAFFKNIKPYQLALIGIITPFIVEGYQYIFRCGDVDIDDIILNCLGYFIGMGIYIIIKKRLLRESE